MKITLILVGLLALAASSRAGRRIKKRDEDKLVEKPVNVHTDKVCLKMSNNTLLADSTDCRMYYHCVDYRAYVMQCHEGYYFNKDLAYCTLGSCSNDVEPSKKCLSSAMKRIPADCQSFSTCVNGQKKNIACPWNMFFDSSFGICRQKDNSAAYRCACAEVDYTLLKDEENCQVYYKCMEGKAERVQCSKGHYYNDQINACIQDIDGVCPIAVKQQATHAMKLLLIKPKKPKNYSHDKASKSGERI